MTTELAIAAIKAQALWDAGDQLQRQAAELHPEFARMLDAAEWAMQHSRSDIEMYEDWSNDLAACVPERYEASEGAQEACISAWLVDVLADLGRFRSTLQRIALDDGDEPGSAGWAREALAAEASGEVTPEVRAEMGTES